MSDESKCPNEITIDGTKYIKEKLNADRVRAVGNKVLIRTVTHYHVGRITSIDDKFITLTEASWVADTGRFNEALKTGKLNEVEPFEGPVDVNLGAVVDLTLWKHALPNAVK